MLDPLAAVRALHFASTIAVVGAALFSVLVAEPVWARREDRAVLGVALLRDPDARLVWLSLCLALGSGVVWLLLVAADITGETWTEVVPDGMAWTVLTATQFGFIAQLRLLLAGIVIGLLALSRRWRGGAPDWLRVLVAATAALLVGSLAWTGHASGASGAGANMHLIADVLHILAAGVWLGGLVPLALLVGRLGHAADSRSLAVCALVLRRFSNVGVIAVAALIASGIINTWFLTDHMRDLIGTNYGRLLQVKIGLFLAMFCLAADNRLRLLPRISRAEGQVGLAPQSASALRQLRRNTALEIALGCVVIYVVGMLGMTPPAGHLHGG